MPPECNGDSATSGDSSDSGSSSAGTDGHPSYPQMVTTALSALSGAGSPQALRLAISTAYPARARPCDGRPLCQHCTEGDGRLRKPDTDQAVLQTILPTKGLQEKVQWEGEFKCTSNSLTEERGHATAANCTSYYCNTIKRRNWLAKYRYIRYTGTSMWMRECS